MAEDTGGLAPDHPARAYEAIDQLSAWATERAAPFRCGIARSPDEIDAVYRLRYEVVVEHDWAPRGAMPDGIERDRHDDASVHVAVWDHETLAGTCRLVLPLEGCLMPMEELLGERIAPEGRVVEWGRVVVARPYRGDPQHVVSGALFGTAWLEMRSRGFVVCAGMAAEPIIGLFRSLGFEISVLGPARKYWGKERYPIRSVAAAPVRSSWMRADARWLGAEEDVDPGEVT